MKSDDLPNAEQAVSKWLKFLTNKEIQLSIKYLFNYLIITLLSLINQVFFIPEKLFKKLFKITLFIIAIRLILSYQIA